jgi:hypothetical protein
MDCIVLDIKGKGMLRYKGRNYCLFSTIEDALCDMENSNPISMWKDFEVIEWA